MTRLLLAASVVLALGHGAPPQQAVFSARVTNVRVDALVTDGRQVLPGLQPADFEVLDNGVVQQVDLMAAERVPLNVVLALDMSGSVTGERLTHLRVAAKLVVDALLPGEKVGLILFNAGVGVQTALTTDFTLVRRALDAPSNGGDTALVDASYAAMTLSESDSGRALAIVFSDGADTASFLSGASVVTTARRSDAVVYAASAGGAGRSTFLRDLCETTGGRLLNVRSTSGLGEAFVSILEEFRQRYLISFTPRGVPTDGWHDLTVRVKNRRNAEVKARRGYFGK